MRALKDLSSKVATLAPGEVSAQVSEILRRYFLERYKIPAPFRTTHEIFQGTSLSGSSLRVHKYASLAALWDQLSFAPVPGTSDEAVQLVDKAILHLEEDRP